MDVEPVKGFHLARYVAVSEQAEAESFRCANPNGICAHVIDRAEDIWRNNGYWDGELERCMKYVPNASRCNIYAQPETPAEEDEDARCNALSSPQYDLINQNEAAGIECPWAYRYESLDGEHAEPLTVTLGVGGLELSVARPWE